MKPYSFFNLDISEQSSVLLEKVKPFFNDGCTINYVSKSSLVGFKCNYTFSINDICFNVSYNDDNACLALMLLERSTNCQLFQFLKSSFINSLITKELKKLIDNYNVASLFNISSNSQEVPRETYIYTFLNNDEYEYNADILFISEYVSVRYLSVSSVLNNDNIFTVSYRLSGKLIRREGTDLYELFEIFLYDAYLKEKFGIKKRTKNSLKIAEMLSY